MANLQDNHSFNDFIEESTSSTGHKNSTVFLFWILFELLSRSFWLVDYGATKFQIFAWYIVALGYQRRGWGKWPHRQLHFAEKWYRLIFYLPRNLNEMNTVKCIIYISKKISVLFVNDMKSFPLRKLHWVLTYITAIYLTLKLTPEPVYDWILYSKPLWDKIIGFSSLLLSTDPCDRWQELCQDLLGLFQIDNSVSVIYIFHYVAETESGVCEAPCALLD